MKYEVRIPKVHYSYYFVEARNPEAAKHLALFGKNKNEVKVEFFKTLEEGIEVIELKGDK